jgi:hypothetical protein
MFGAGLLEGRKCKGKSISGAPLWLAAGAGHAKVVEVLLAACIWLCEKLCGMENWRL